LPVKKRACQILMMLVTALPALGQITNSDDVARILAQALTRASQLVGDGTSLGHDPSHFFTNNPVVAVVDREGFVLGVRSLFPDPDPFDAVDAITKAGTAAFLSSDQNAFSSRTAGFIVGQHFPPGIRNRTPGPLVGVNFSNMSFSDVNRFKDPSTYDPFASALGGTNGAPITPDVFAALSGLAGSPGGVPLYKNGKLIGGVGAAVTGHPPIPELYDIQVTAKQRPDLDEDVALAGQIGFEPVRKIFGSDVFIDGIRVPYVNTRTKLDTNSLLVSPGFAVASLVTMNPYETTSSPIVHYPLLNLGGVDGELRAPITDDPVAGTIDGELRLSAAEVTNILTLAAQRAVITRAGIRLPRGQPAQVFISVVNNPNQPGVAPVVLGTFRTGTASNIFGATIFSWDVCVQKARTALYFSDTNRAYSCRTVGFLAQSLYPPGIVHTVPGPFLGMQENFSLLGLAAPLLPTGVTNILNGVYFTTNSPSLASPDPNLPNGITIFPGGFPLYRHGKLIGAIGVSGDGVDQDDIIAASGTISNPPPASIRADHMRFRGARLPYAKFPRNPSL
jgi:uncharacterized protein GlcG (DUF336 family)